MFFRRSGQGRSNFYYALSLLPKEKREAMRRIYDFCRYTDDIVDEGNDSTAVRQERLLLWRNEVSECYNGVPNHPLLFELGPVLSRYEIPESYLQTLIDGMEMDLTKTRYESLEELKKYCYAVAGVVGLISMKVFGSRNEKTKAYAIELGYALQLTNILRDLQQDAANGRIYLPAEDLRNFHYKEGDLLQGLVSDHFRTLMQFEVSRAKEFYNGARKQLAQEDRASMFAAEIMRAIYFQLLKKIERANYDVFSKRIRVSNFYKMWTAFRFWLLSRLPSSLFRA